VAGAPLLWYILAWLDSQPCINRIIIACGPKFEDIRDYISDARVTRKPIHLIDERTRLGRGGAVKNALRSRQMSGLDPVVVINGDIITNMELGTMIEAHQASDKEVTVLVTRVRNAYGVVRTDASGQATCYEEKPLQPELINAGVYVLTPSQKLLLRLPEMGDWEDDLLPALAREGKLGIYEDNSHFWVTIDNPRDIFDAEERLLEFIREGLFGKRSS
jgi:mannose-1-phosphate guanylyltransferase